MTPGWQALQLLFFLSILLGRSHAYTGDSLSDHLALWPEPQVKHFTDNFVAIDPSLWTWVCPEQTACSEQLQRVFARFKRSMFRSVAPSSGNSSSSSSSSSSSVGGDSIGAGRRGAGALPPHWRSKLQLGEVAFARQAQIHVKDDAAPLDDKGMREEYNIVITTPALHVYANTQYGVMRALETLSQMVAPMELDVGLSQPNRMAFLVPEGNITDYPRFPHRGLLLDTSRHFLPLQLIMQMLDAMSWNKLNVLHWHLVDDQSFPWATATYPRLAQMGAYGKALTYSPADIAKLLAYAGDLGIRVVVEIDTPGHTQSWGRAMPQLLTRCYTDEGKPSGSLGPLDPTADLTYSVVGKLLQEAAQTFPDPYLHLGGDEVDFSCWSSNPSVRAWMDSHRVGSYEGLQSMYTQRVLAMAADLKRQAVVWQEVYDTAAAGIKRHAAGAGTNGSSSSSSDASSGGSVHNASNTSSSIISRSGLLAGLDPERVIVQVWKWFDDPPPPQVRQAGDASARDSSAGCSSSTVRSDSGSSSDSRDGSGGAGMRSQPGRRSLAASSRMQRSSRSGSMHNQPVTSSIGQQQQKTATPSAASSAGGGSGSGLHQRSPEEVYLSELSEVTAAGYKAILSAPWYLDWISYGQDWIKYYSVEPLDFEGSQEQKQLVIGGEACMWTEYVDATNLMSRTWPRACAVAERLWSSRDERDVERARMRLRTHRCRMLARGAPAEPIGPGFCPGDDYFPDQTP